MKTSDNWGGARAGAGRKAPDGNRVAISCRVLPETLEKMKKTDKPIGKLIDELVKGI